MGERTSDALVVLIAFAGAFLVTDQQGIKFGLLLGALFLAVFVSGRYTLEHWHTFIDKVDRYV